MSDEARIAQHYTTEGIVERILAALKAAGKDTAPLTVETLAPFDHFHGRGVVATEALVAVLAPQPGERILDIGSGIGGPARWIAAKCGAQVTGVDLTPAFCAAARALNELTGLTDRVRIFEGSALDLPLPDAAFDRAYSQNVIMNIADKARFYREACRVLRPGGVLALSNVCAGPAGEPYFPVPWAATRDTSFLVSPEETRADIEAAGFGIVSFRDTSAETAQTQQRQRERIERAGPPPFGVHVTLGAHLAERQVNSGRSLTEGRTRTIEVLARKPG